MTTTNPDITRKSKRERFLEMAEKRTNTVLNKLRVLGNCSNRAAYEYGDEDLRQIFEVIDKQLALVKARFQDKKSIDFRLR